MKLPKILMALAAAMSLSASAWAGVSDLPVVVRDGVAYHFYEVQPKETIYSLSRKLGLSRQEMEKYNPELVDGLKANSTLYFPVAENEIRQSAITHRVKKGETVYGISRQYGITPDQLIAQNPIARDGLKSGMVLQISAPAPSELASASAPQPAPAAPEAAPAPTPETVITPLPIPEQAIPAATDIVVAEDEFNPEPAPADTMTAPAVPQNSPVRIAVVLPFELDKASPSKEAALYTEFFKGMLVAADSLRRADAPIIISAYDAGADLAATRSLLASTPELATMQAIILPPKDDQLQAVADFARDNNIMALNAYAVRDASHTTNPAVMQMNLPSANMYSRAIKAMRRALPAHTPVIISRNGGPTDHSEFIETLKAELAAEGMPFKELSFADRLKDSDLSQALGDDPAASWVFIPLSGRQPELNRILPALIDRQAQAQLPSNIALFGYPEWILYKGETLSNLQQLGASAYSRFFAEPDSPNVQHVEQAFTRWYGSPMENKVPRQGLTGFDTAWWLIDALRSNAGDFNALSPAYDGAQYGFDFVRDGAGWVNQTLFLVNFGPGSLITRQTTQAR